MVQILVKLFDTATSPEAVVTNALDSLPLECETTSTVQDLKKQIAATDTQPGLSVDRLQLTFNGRVLSDSSTVSELENNGLLFAIIGSGFKQEGVSAKKKPKTVREIDIMRVFNGLRLCLSERTKRQRMHVTLLSRENTRALLTTIPGLADDPEAVCLLKNPPLLYRMAAAPEECHKLITKHPLLGEALSQVVSQIANSNATDDSNLTSTMFNDPVVALVSGLGLLEEEEEPMEGVQPSRRQQGQQPRRQNAPPSAIFAPRAQQQVRPPDPAQPTISPQMLSNALSAVLLGLAQQQQQQQQQPSQPSAQPSQPAPVPPPPQQRFAAELATMRSMGVANDAAALAALEATNGNIEAAIELIFSSME